MTKETTGIFDLRIKKPSSDVAYLRLPSYPLDESVKVAKTVRLYDLVGIYDGPDILIDFIEDGTPIGIEVLVDNDEYDDEDEG